MKKQTQNPEKTILRNRNKLVSLNLTLKDTREKSAVSFAISLIDKLLDGDFVLNKKLAKTYATSSQKKQKHINKPLTNPLQ